MSENSQQENISQDFEDALDSETELSNGGLCAKLQPHLEATNAKVKEDLSTIRDYLDIRKELEEKAIVSLSEVEDMIESMFKDYCRTIEENHQLRDTGNQLATLSADIEELEQAKSKAIESEAMSMSKLEVMANHTKMLEEQLALLTDEHTKLKESNNELIKSIIVCQNEICKYEFE